METTEDWENTVMKCFHNNGEDMDMRSTFSTYGNSGSLVNEEQSENVGKTDINNLNIHNMEKTLESLKLFKCDICMKSFAWKSHLTIHSYTHTGEKPFKCNFCSKSYSENLPD